MAAYLPVIAINATGVADVVENGQNGILSTDSTEEWAKNLVFIMKNRNVLTGMRIGARRTAQRYSEKIIAARILSHYQYLQKNYQAEQWLYYHLGRNYQTILLKENY